MPHIATPPVPNAGRPPRRLNDETARKFIELLSSVGEKEVVALDGSFPDKQAARREASVVKRELERRSRKVTTRVWKNRRGRFYAGIRPA